MTARTRQRDTLETVVIASLLRLADLARARNATEDEIAHALGRAYALVDGWSHYRARLILTEHAIEPLARTLRELDAIAAHATREDVEGWKPLELPRYDIDGSSSHAAKIHRIDD